MYTPKHFRNDNTDEVKEFIRQNNFGILVSQHSGRIVATHIPFEFSDGKTKLIAHVARANPQWKGFDGNSEVLVIFSGPHTYVSSSWYTITTVPTWNYIAAHVYGSIRIIEGEELYQSLVRLLNTYEKNSDNPITEEKLTRESIQKQMQGVVGFEIEITRIEASYKLSQNRDDQSHSNIIRELEKQTDDNAQHIAQAMKKNRCPLH